MSEGFNATRREIEILEARKEIDRLRKVLREAERFMAYFSGETDGAFVGPGTPQKCLEQIRAALAFPPDSSGVRTSEGKS